MRTKAGTGRVIFPFKQLSKRQKGRVQQIQWTHRQKLICLYNKQTEITVSMCLCRAVWNLLKWWWGCKDQGSLLPFSTHRANTNYYRFYWWNTNKARQSKKIKMTPDQQADLQFVRKLHINAQTLQVWIKAFHTISKLLLCITGVHTTRATTSSCYTKRQYTLTHEATDLVLVMRRRQKHGC